MAACGRESTSEQSSPNLGSRIDGWGIASIDFTGMSGHAMLAAAIYPVLAVVFVPPTSARRAVAMAAAAAAGVILLVAVSRVAIDAIPHQRC